MMMIYTDIIHEQLVGDGTANLLKVTSISTDARHLEFENLCYYLVRLKTIRSISISIKNENGKNISFDKSSNVCVALHFRKKFI